MPISIAPKDKSYIREEYKKTPIIETQKRLADEYGCSIGDIQWILGKLADKKRLEDKRLIQDANERHREKTIAKQKERKVKKNEGVWELPTVTVKSVQLKVTLEQDKKLYEHYTEFRSFANFIKEGIARTTSKILAFNINDEEILTEFNDTVNALLNEHINDKQEKTLTRLLTKLPKGNSYDFVKKYRQKNGNLDPNWLCGCATSFCNTTIPTAIRGVYLGKVGFPFSGKISPETTSNSIEVIKENDKYWLLFDGLKIEILYQNHDEYYGLGTEKQLHEYWDEGVYHGGYILKAKNGNWYVKFGIPRKESTFKWDENSKKVFMVIQPTFNELGIVWNAEYFNELNQQVFRATLLHAVSTSRLLSKEKDYRTIHVRIAIKKLFRVWHERFQTMKPMVVLQETIGTQKREITNMNPTFILQEKLKSKLSEVNGFGANIQDVEPFNIEVIRSRLAI
jgi:hypothetical protein